MNFASFDGRLTSGGSRKKYLGGPGPSSFGKQPRLSEITIEAISGILPKFTLETWRPAVSAER